MVVVHLVAEEESDNRGDSRDGDSDTKDEVFLGLCLLYTSPSPRDQRGSGETTFSSDSSDWCRIKIVKIIFFCGLRVIYRKARD